jgi:hypothetical protein
MKVLVQMDMKSRTRFFKDREIYKKSPCPEAFRRFSMFDGIAQAGKLINVTVK